jgi:group I intron endonuclease
MFGGVYRILNKVNEKYYIGSTSNFSERKCCHFSYLRKNKHHNPHLQLSYNKYGKDAFEFIVVEQYENPSKEVLEEAEQWYLDNTPCCDKRYGYNISNLAERCMLGKNNTD